MRIIQSRTTNVSVFGRGRYLRTIDGAVCDNVGVIWRTGHCGHR